MRSIVFVINTMNVGGVEKALLGVLNRYLAEGWEVHVAMLKIGGGFLPYIPRNVIIHRINGFDEVRPLIHTPLKATVLTELHSGKFADAFRHGICLIQQKFRKSSTLLYDIAFRSVPEFSHELFDVAVAFAGPDAFIDTYVDKCINAKEKWGWIHFDITKFGVDRGIIRKVYRNYSLVNIVSREAKAIFDQEFPQFASRTILTPNIIDRESILRMADESMELPKADGKKIILTVGRISKEKGQFLALKAVQDLINDGIMDFEWWFVGDGTDMDRCRKFATENGLNDFVRFIGAKANPYPYMKACAIYVQPSEHEGFCITLAEARLFGMPIIATDFTGAREQLESYPESMITGHDSLAISKALRKFL